MCLHHLSTPEKTRKWLKKQPDVIIAYKCVRIGSDGKYYPICSHHGRGQERFFPRRINRIKWYRVEIRTCWGYQQFYKPYYHLFKYITPARDWADLECSRVVKCAIPKKDITAIGTQDGSFVIVTKAFKILGEVK